MYIADILYTSLLAACAIFIHSIYNNQFTNHKPITNMRTLVAPYTHVVPAPKEWSRLTFIDTYMQSVPVFDINDALILSVAETLMLSEKISPYRKIQIAESVYEIANSLTTNQNVNIYLYAWTALKTHGTFEQKNALRCRLNEINNSTENIPFKAIKIEAIH